jgi:uncharacterized membrane protein YkvA (DUF1232 family)
MSLPTSLFEKLKSQAQKLKAETYALYLAYRDPRTPWYAKAWAGLVLAYAFSPLDLIPDFIPVLGYLDDLLLVPAGIALALRLIPPEVMAESREKVKEIHAKPVNWWTGALIILLWLALAGMGILWLLRISGITS